MISVVLPVRDGERFLDEAVRSILDQSFTALELIIVDDGSSDGTSRIIAAAAERDRRVRAIHLDGVGVATALNIGIERAHHPWIARMDADDVALPGRFERQWTVATARPEVGAWATWARAIDGTGRAISLMSDGPTTLEEFQRQHRVGSLRPIHSTMLIRRDILLAAGGYDGTFDRAQDIELWDRFGELAPILTLPEPLLHVRVHAGSATTVQFEETARIHRFVAARRAAAERGRTLTHERFLALEREAPLRRRLVRRMSTAAARHHRHAGVRYAERRHLRGIAHLALAVLLDPRTTLRRAWQQFVAPRLRGHAADEPVHLGGDRDL